MELNHNFKKKFGQNFLTDKNLLESIVSDAGITKNDVVLEIGAGAGALTEPLTNHAKKLFHLKLIKIWFRFLKKSLTAKIISSLCLVIL